MPEQIIKVTRAPEHPPTDLRELKAWLWQNYPESEWIVEEIQNQKETMKITLQIEKAQVLTGKGTDQIILKLDPKFHPTPYPSLNYPCCLKIETQAKHGAEYCRKLGIQNVELTNV